MTMTHIEDEIERAKKQAAARIARLKKAAAEEQRKIDRHVIDLLREQHAELHAQLTSEAMVALERSRDRRSRRARRDIHAVTEPSAEFGTEDHSAGNEGGRDGA